MQTKMKSNRAMSKVLILLSAAVGVTWSAQAITVTLNLGLKDADGNAVTASFVQTNGETTVVLPEDLSGVDPRIRRAGYRFAGYWTEDGTCVYGPDYEPTEETSSYETNLTLHARWEVAPSILTVTSSGDDASTLDVYGNTAVTLRDAMTAITNDSSLVGADGLRRIVFDLAENDTVVRLKDEIAIPSGVRSFGIFASANGARIVAAAGARHLHFQGAPSDADGVFALSGLTFEGGSPAAGAGGAILADSGAKLAVCNCSFLGNRAGEGADGGAIGVSSSQSTLLVTATTFAGNESVNGGAVSVNGAWATFVNTTFSTNAATVAGGGLFVSNAAPVRLVACTFAGNAAAGGGPSLAGVNTSAAGIRAANTVFADATPDSESPVKTDSADALAADWCLLGGVCPGEVFANSGAPVTQLVAGVTHVVHPPLEGVNAGGDGAAEIFHDAEFANLLAVGSDGRQVVLSGSADLAKVPLVVDQLASVRTVTTCGARRLAVGTEPVTVELDGVLLAEDGQPRSGSVTSEVRVSYDDGQTNVTNSKVTPVKGGIFGFSVPVDGSDGLVHNVTGIEVPALGPNPIEVTTAPYALTAASAGLISSDDFLSLDGDGIAIGTVEAGAISVARTLDARSAGSFTAGSLRGFRKIDLEQVEVAGGSLRWLGGDGAAAGRTFANLTNMTVGGGVPAGQETAFRCVAGKTLTKDWTAANDGFLQLQALSKAPANGDRLGLKILENGVDVLVVTPMGTVGPEGKARRLLWTVPVRKGQTVLLTMSAAASAFTLSSVRAQFIYFGVEE